MINFLKIIKILKQEIQNKQTMNHHKILKKVKNKSDNYFVSI